MDSRESAASSFNDPLVPSGGKQIPSWRKMTGYVRDFGRASSPLKEASMPSRPNFIGSSMGSLKTATHQPPGLSSPATSSAAGAIVSQNSLDVQAEISAFPASSNVETRASSEEHLNYVEPEWEVTPLSQSLSNHGSPAPADPFVGETIAFSMNEKLIADLKDVREAFPANESAHSIVAEKTFASSDIESPIFSRQSSPAVSLAPTGESSSHSPSPSSPPAPQDPRSKKEKKKAKQAARKGLAAQAVLEAQEEVNAATAPDSTNEEASTILLKDEKPRIDPLELIRNVIKELSSTNITFFKQPISGSISAPRTSFTKTELEEAESKVLEMLTEEVSSRPLEDIEKEWQATKKETEALEKKLVKLIKRNRKIVSADSLKV